MGLKFGIPSNVDGYNIMERIGYGGNSYVFKAEKDGRLYALKIFKFALRGEKLQRFLDEVEFQSRTTCGNIVKILQKGKILIDTGANYPQKRVYYVMNLYECSFDKLIETDSDSRHLLKLYLDICGALKFVHNYSRGKIIHRDIKPQNFLYDSQNDRLLLSDFGIACFNKNHIIKTDDKKIGNFSYSAPEQRKLKGKKYGTYTDIYSMGLILNEIFTKEIPNGVEYRLIRETSPLYCLLDDVVYSMLKNEPEERESNIVNIVNKVNYSIAIYDENIDDILNDFEDQFEDFTKENKRLISEDLALIKFYHQKFKTHNRILNDLYHADIRYPYKRNLIDSLKLISLYNSIKNKFLYENNLPKEDLFSQHAEAGSLVNRLDLTIKSLNYFRDYGLVRIGNESVTLFKTLSYYHQREIFVEFERQKFRTEGTIYNLFEDFSQLEEFEEIRDGTSMISYIKLPNSISFNDERFFICDYQQAIRHDYAVFASKFNLTVIYEDSNRVVLICHDIEWLEKILIMISNMLSTHTSYVLEGDLMDCKNVIQHMISGPYAITNSFVFESTLCGKILGFISSH